MKSLILVGTEVYLLEKITEKTIKARGLSANFDQVKTFKKKNSDARYMSHYPLTEENAPTAKYIINIQHPEWGVQKFNYNSEMEGVSTRGSGYDTSCLFNDEFRLWCVVGNYIV